MMDIKGVLLQWFIKFFIKKTTHGAIENEIMQNKELAEELHKPIIRKLENEKYTYLLWIISWVLI